MPYRHMRPRRERGWRSKSEGGVAEAFGGKLSLEDGDEEVAAAAGGLEEAGVEALGFVGHELEHGLDEPGRGKDLPMVGDALLGLDEAHGWTRVQAGNRR